MSHIWRFVKEKMEKKWKKVPHVGETQQANATGDDFRSRSIMPGSRPDYQ
jgi:hypothetical protein